ncbi:vWA domain-containing protein [Isosphaera pallida]|uniref:vWA domain-containing protein n=1 Tax=Isosphaera pallida TaxID=128 RepID=UPI0009D77FF8|nr:VWA domain-containing protein [Isosphaera pallida]
MSKTFTLTTTSRTNSATRFESSAEFAGWSVSPATRPGFRRNLRLLALCCVAIGWVWEGTAWFDRLGSQPPPQHPLGSGRDWVLVIDVSRSMAARDAPPSRLETAQTVANALIDLAMRSPHDRVALIVFSDRAVIRTPLTRRADLVRRALARLRPGELRPGGSHLAEAVTVAQNLLIRSKRLDDPAFPRSAAIWLLSDGESPRPPGISLLSASPAPIHVVAVGRAEPPGAPVPLANGILRSRQGQPILSSRDDATLAKIAQTTKGVMIRLEASPSPIDFQRALIRELDLAQTLAPPTFTQPLAPLPSLEERFDSNRNAASWQRPGLVEWLCMVGLGSLVVLTLRNPLHLPPTKPSVSVKEKRRIAGVTALVALILCAARAAHQTSADGLTLWREGRFAEALEVFLAQASAHPRRFESWYNVGVTFETLGRWDDAARALDEAARWLDQSSDPPNAINTINQARLLLARGNLEARRGVWGAAIASYQACLDLPKGAEREAAVLQALQNDARVNLDALIRWRSSAEAISTERRGESEGRPGDRLDGSTSAASSPPTDRFDPGESLEPVAATELAEQEAESVAVEMDAFARVGGADGSSRDRRAQAIRRLEAALDRLEQTRRARDRLIDSSQLPSGDDFQLATGGRPW